MSAYPLTPELLGAAVRSIREQRPTERLIAVHVAGGWSGPSVVGAGPERIPVVSCPSVLAVHL